MKIWPLILSITISCCTVGGQELNKDDNEGYLIFKTRFYNAQGNVVLSDTIKLWFFDSTVIQDLHTINQLTDTANKTTTTLEIFAYRYVDLVSKAMYDYSSFSDTARILKKSLLPDTMFVDYGWNFNSDKLYKVVGNPMMLADTTIENVVYKRAKFNTNIYGPDKFYQIGYFACNNRGFLFSLEKPFSRKLNCTMTKTFTYKIGNPIPIASQEIEFLSNKLSPEEKDLFKVWKQNITTFPLSE